MNLKVLLFCSIVGCKEILNRLSYDNKRSCGDSLMALFHPGVREGYSTGANRRAALLKERFTMDWLNTKYSHWSKSSLSI